MSCCLVGQHQGIPSRDEGAGWMRGQLVARYWQMKVVASHVAPTTSLGGWGCTLHAEDSTGYDEKQADVKQGGGLFVHNDERTAH
ncbi:hypothetical protein IG631_07540 [Alternaria alternata]|jgi:hypothetical protein|nr:hypothetical protein IG631_07540 [Alternaria alternata]